MPSRLGRRRRWRRYLSPSPITSIAMNLADAPRVRRECALALIGAAAETERGRCPEVAVAGRSLRAQVRALGDQRRECLDRLHLAELGDADEAVRVEVVAEQQRHGLVSGAEEPP